MAGWSVKRMAGYPRAQKAIMAAAGIGIGGGMAGMAFAGIGSSLTGDPSTDVDPHTYRAAYRIAKYAGIGAVSGGLLAGGLATAIGGPRVGLMFGAGGAAAGASVGGLVAGMQNRAVRRGAYTGGTKGSMLPQTRMSSSLTQVNQLRTDIARLHRPIRGTGY